MYKVFFCCGSKNDKNKDNAIKPKIIIIIILKKQSIHTAKEMRKCKKNTIFYSSLISHKAKVF
jgi:hypothetical protein